MNVEQAVDLWFSLSVDQSNLKEGTQNINRFLKRASFDEESAYYAAINDRKAEKTNDG